MTAHNYEAPHRIAGVGGSKPWAVEPSGRLTLADARAIAQNLQSAYIHALDAGLTDEVVGQFAPSGRAEIAGRPVATGHAAIRELYDGVRPQAPQLHLVENLRVDEVLDSEVRAVSNFALLVLADGAWRCVATGRYDDVVARGDDGHWLFASKQTTFVAATP